MTFYASLSLYRHALVDPSPHHRSCYITSTIRRRANATTNDLESLETSMRDVGGLNGSSFHLSRASIPEGAVNVVEEGSPSNYGRRLSLL